MAKLQHTSDFLFLIRCVQINLFTHSHLQYIYSSYTFGIDVNNYTKIEALVTESNLA